MRPLAQRECSWCEGCGAPLYFGDDYLTDENGVAGCWATMSDETNHPCYAGRVGKSDANLASVDTRPEGGDSTKIEAPFTGGAVPHEDAADAQPIASSPKEGV